MKKILTIALLLGTISLNAQTVEEVINEYSTRMGGLEKYKAAKTVTMTGNIKQQGLTIPISIQIINGKAVRTDVNVQGTKIIEAYKNGKGWKDTPGRNR